MCTIKKKLLYLFIVSVLRFISVPPATVGGFTHNSTKQKK
jgi:hypothetical protein